MSEPEEQGAAPGEPRSRRGRRSRMAARASGAGLAGESASAGMTGGRYAPLSDADAIRIHAAALVILETIGLSEAPPSAIARVTAAGGRLDETGRLLFPRDLVERALAGLRRGPTLHGRREGHELHLAGRRVHMGSGGAAPLVVDLESGAYRQSSLRDLHDAARLVDGLSHIHFFSRSLVARDMTDPLALDINTAYASLAGTAKHVMVAASHPAHVASIAEMCFAIAGSREAFIERPFLSLNINHVVPPLRFAAEAVEVLQEAARLGLPVHCNVFGQVGASSPVTIAGAVAQSTAEALAGMILAWLVDPGAVAIMGARPMITDLRTGAMSGGSGEQAAATAAAIQMAQHYDLPNSTIAGATDSKLADAQSGYEKALTLTLAAQAGCNLITQAAGMHAGLMAAAFESYVVDNDMLGAIMSSLRPLEVSEETLALASIERAVRGEGHFLGAPETLSRMESDFCYPDIADRRPFAEWEADGRPDIRSRARERARQMLAAPAPRHLNADIDRRLRARFDIRLAVDADTSGGDRP